MAIFKIFFSTDITPRAYRAAKPPFMRCITMSKTNVQAKSAFGIPMIENQAYV
jgi:hypothetical protein